MIFTGGRANNPTATLITTVVEPITYLVIFGSSFVAVSFIFLLRRPELYFSVGDNSFEFRVDEGLLMSQLAYSPLKGNLVTIKKYNYDQHYSRDLLFPFQMTVQARILEPGFDLFASINLDALKSKDETDCRYSLFISDGLWVILKFI